MDNSIVQVDESLNKYHTPGNILLRDRSLTDKLFVGL